MKDGPMETIFSRLAATPSLKQVFAVIEVVNNTLSLYARLPVTIAAKINAAFKFAVKHVLLCCDVAKVAPAIIRSLSIDVINFYWLLSGHQKVGDTVGKVDGAFVAKSAIAVRCLASNTPKKISRFGIVNDFIADGFWYKFRSHSDTSYVGLVRGLVTAITSTPTLTQGYSHV
jgi:hypothetical protein